MIGAGSRSVSPCAVLPTGSAAVDFPLTTPAGEEWFLNQIGGEFVLVTFGLHSPAGHVDGSVPHLFVGEGQTIGNNRFQDHKGHGKDRYGDSWTYLFRPDQHVAAVFSAAKFNDAALALRKATGQ